MRTLLFFLSLFLWCQTASVTHAQEYFPFDPFSEETTQDFYPTLSNNLLHENNTLPDDESSEISISSDLLIDKKSRLELYYSGRIKEDISQFGYDSFFKGNIPNKDFIPSGAVQDDFVLARGDRLSLILRGQINSTKIYAIDRDGLLIPDNFTPLPAAGKTISQVRAALKSQLETLPNVDLYLSLSEVSQIDVLVIGHVNNPGRKSLSVFHTVLDILDMAGGISKDGSLRNIKLVRRGQTRVIDLYDLFIDSSGAQDIKLQNGDRIIVPPIGPTIAVAGAVKRPGIYELSAHGMRHEQLSLNSTLSLAGGPLNAGQNRFLHLSLSASGTEDVQQINQQNQFFMKDSSILFVGSMQEARQDFIELKGPVRQSGLHALSKYQTLSNLLHPLTLGTDIYPLIGLIERYDPNTLNRDYLSFPPHKVIRGNFDQRLMSGDVIHLFSRDQIAKLNAPSGGSVQKIAMNTVIDRTSLPPILENILTEHNVSITGEVRQPGHYPIAEDVTLSDILSAAGNFTLNANQQRIELTSKQLHTASASEGQRGLVDLSTVSAITITLSPGDTIRVNQKTADRQEQVVILKGEVRHPGSYPLMPGDRLSTLLARAGGLTPEAYPQGAIFSRAKERKAEEQRYRAVAQDIERSLASALSKDADERPNEAQITLTRNLAAELREVAAVGRITVEASPDRLLSDPELDVLLEADDKIYIPKRPSTVRVRGEVLSPANLQFRSGKSPKDYLMEAGGFTHHADKDRSFVIYPDGSAQPLYVSNWNYKPVMIPPGSTIVVPRDPKPFDFMQTAKDISQILANLAVSAVVVDDISDD